MYPTMNVRHPAPPVQHPPVHCAPRKNDVLRYGTPNKKLVDAVIHASENDFVSLMHAALAEGADINIVDEHNKNLIEMAVARDSVRIARALIAQGVLLPDPDCCGFDLLMHTAVHGNAPMMELLMDAYDMQPDATDIGGWTALHYAAMSRSSAALEALLRRDLACNDSATGTHHNQLCQILGEKSGLSDGTLTPLNIAIASGNSQSVQLLLQHGAQILTGYGNSLLKAVQCGDPATLEILLSHCKHEGNLYAVLNQQILNHSVIYGADAQMLKLLLDCHRILPIANFDLEDTLLDAVTLERTEQLALLLDEGVRLDPTLRFYWSLASTAKDRNILDLLTASCSDTFERMLVMPDGGGPARLLTELTKHVADSVALSSRGIFIAILHDAMPALASLGRESDSLSEAQIAAETAHILLRFLRGSPKTDNDTSDKERDPHQPLIPAATLQRDQVTTPPHYVAKIPEVMTERRRRMVVLAESQLEALHHSLSHCLSAEFFTSIHELVEDGDMVPDMQRRLREGTGVPDALVRLMVDTWAEAMNIILKQSNSSAALDPTAVSRLMANTLFCKLDQINIDFGHFLTRPNSLLHDCKKKLRADLSAQRTEWRMMITQPTNFLRKLEGRTGLRPVAVPVLTQAMVNATGLPADMCRSMASCWQRAVEDAGRAPDSGSVPQRFQPLDRAFAGYWQDWLEEHSADAETVLFPFTVQDVLDAREWCVQARQAQTASAGSLKRKAGAEPDGAPPPKPPRLH